MTDKTILTSINFIKSGVNFPPANQTSRLKAYTNNLKHYKGIYNKDRALLVKTREGFRKYDDKLITLNYFRLDTDKLIGLMFNEKPNVLINDKDIQTETVNTLSDIDFWSVIAKGVVASEVLGDAGIGVNVSDGSIYYTNAQLVYKIVSPVDIDYVTHYVLAHPIYETTFEGNSIKETQTHTRFIIHERGKITEYVHTTSSTGVLGDRVDYKTPTHTIPKDGVTYITGLEGFAFHMLHANKPIDTIYGRSSYNKIKDLVYELEKRMTLGSITIDKNIESMLVVPRNLLKTNERTGEVSFGGEGNMIALAPGSDKPEYVAPEGKTEANDTLMGRLIDEIVRQTEYGKVFLFGDYSSASGEALKTLMKGALDRVSRKIDTIDFTVKMLICQIMSKRGVTLSPSDVTIQWQDGITESITTITDTIVKRYQSGTASLESLLAKYDGLTEEQIILEIQRIKENITVTDHNKIDTKTEEDV